MMTQTEALLVLNAIEGLGSQRIKKLIDYYGSALRVMSLSLAQLSNDLIVSQGIAEKIVNFRKDEFLEKEQAYLKREGVKVIAYTDDQFPSQLKEIPDAPILLYVKGQWPLNDKIAIAIVGSRKASLYGITMARKFASRLSEYGITIVSGLARGVDTAAHRGTLDNHGQTIAVLGSGLACIYPKENTRLFNEVAVNGAVLSEFPMTMPPLAHNFPRRNRIISGLSLGVIVAEAAQKSGALITADFALEQGRDVFAIPGKIDNPMAKGVNALIKQGAKVITAPEDILEDIQLQIEEQLKTRMKDDEMTEGYQVSTVLSEKEQSVLSQLGRQPKHINDFIKQDAQAPFQTATVLLELELKKLIRQYPGKMFVRC